MSLVGDDMSTVFQLPVLALVRADIALAHESWLLNSGLQPFRLSFNALLICLRTNCICCPASRSQIQDSGFQSSEAELEFE